jgi:hypothetical protein
VLESEPIIDRSIDLPSKFWAYAEQFAARIANTRGVVIAETYSCTKVRAASAALFDARRFAANHFRPRFFLLEVACVRRRLLRAVLEVLGACPSNEAALAKGSVMKKFCPPAKTTELAPA